MDQAFDVLNNTPFHVLFGHACVHNYISAPHFFEILALTYGPGPATPGPYAPGPWTINNREEYSKSNILHI